MTAEVEFSNELAKKPKLPKDVKLTLMNLERKFENVAIAFNRFKLAEEAYKANPSINTLAVLTAEGVLLKGAIVALGSEVKNIESNLLKNPALSAIVKYLDLGNKINTLVTSSTAIYEDVVYLIGQAERGESLDVQRIGAVALNTFRFGVTAFDLVTSLNPVRAGAKGIFKGGIILFDKYKDYISPLEKIAAIGQHGFRGNYQETLNLISPEKVLLKGDVVDKEVTVIGRKFSYDMSNGMRLESLADFQNNTDYSDDRSFTYVTDSKGKIVSGFAILYDDFYKSHVSGQADSQATVITRSYYVSDTKKLFDLETSKSTGLMTLKINGEVIRANVNKLKVETKTVIVYENGNPVSKLAIVVSDPLDVTGTAYIVDGNGAYTGQTQTVAVEKLPDLVGSTPSKGDRGFNPNKPVIAIGDIIGSSLGNYLAGDNKLAGIVYSSILGEIGERIGGALNGTPQGVFDATGAVKSSVAASFTSDVWGRMQGAAIGVASSMLASQLAKSLGLKGFGGEIFTTLTSAGTNAVITEVVRNLGNGASTFQNIFNLESVKFGNVFAGAIGSFIGAKLGALLVKPQTEAAAILSSVGSAVGAWAGTTGALGIGSVTSALGSIGITSKLALNILLPGIGAFVGFVLGALIGNLFGKKKKIRVPTASAETALQLPYARYEVGAATAANGGNLDLVTSMAANARDILNGFIAQITYGDDKGFVANLNGYGTTQAYGHTQSQLYVTVNGVRKNVSSADEAVEHGTLAAIRNTKVVGGDLFLKRAVLSSNAQDLLAFSGDLQTARDYAFYGANKALINGYIKDAFATLSQGDQDFYDGGNKAIVDKILTGGTESLDGNELTAYTGNKAQFDRVLAAVGAQTVANPWIVTLLRASELKLDQFATSDFYGGLRGFVESLGGKAFAFENVTVNQKGSGAIISAKTPGQTAGLFDVLPQALSGPGSNDIKDGRFAQPWDLSYYNPNGVGIGRGVNMPGWSGSGNDVLVSNMSHTPNGDLNDQRSDWITSQAGVAYEASVYAAQHRGTAQMLIEYYNSEKQLIGPQHWANGTAREGGAAQGDLNNFNLLSIVSTAPAGTAYRRLNLRLVGNGGEWPYAFFTRPMTRAVTYGNDVTNERFQDFNNTWNVATNSSTGWGRGVNLGTDWSGSGNDSLYAYIQGFTNGQLVDQRSNFIVTLAGESYETSVYAAQHQGSAELWVEYFDVHQGYITAHRMSGTAREGGGAQGNINNYNKLSGISVAPANAAYRRVLLRLASTGGQNPYAFFTLPVSRAVEKTAVNWEDSGHSVWIDQMSKVGYNGSSITAGNDLIDRQGYLAGTTIDDQTTAQVWVESGYYENRGWNGYEYEYEWVDTSHWETQTVSGGDDVFVSGQGNDNLNGRAGWDWLDGQGGHDTLYGGDGNDVLIGGSGNDTLHGEGGDDYLAAGEGSDGAYGGSGNDTIVDGMGSECLIGQEGDDTLLIAADQTFNWFWGGHQPNLGSGDPNGRDTISAERLSVGVSFDLDFRPSDWNGHPDPVASLSAARMAAVVDAQTGAWITSNGLFSIENATGSNFGDRLYGTGDGNVLKGLAGNDQLFGRGGADVMEGGEGADDLWGGGDVGVMDVVSYEGSSAGVYVDLSTGEAFGGDAEGDVLHEFESLRGSKLSDELKGDSATNTIEGLAGDDWIVATGGGTEVYVDYDDYNYYDPYYHYYGGYSYWTGGDVYNGGLGNDTVDYSEATGGVTAYLGSYTATSASGGSGSGGLAGGHSYISIEAIVGSQHGDNLSAGAGAQTFEGGKGNDYLAGGAGSDTYMLSRGDGQDTVDETNDGSNTLTLASDIKFSDLWITTAGGGNGHITVGVRTNDVVTDQVRIAGNFATAFNDKLKVLDMNGAGQLDIGGMDWAPAGGHDGFNDMHGGVNHSDLLVTYNGDDIIRGSGYAWENHGNAIIAGKGNDTIITSTGDDQFAYDRGDGFDNITDAGGEDTIVFGATAAADDVIYQVQNHDLIIGLKDSDDPNKTATQVSNSIRVVGGGVIWREVDPYDHEIVYSETLNTVEFVLAGGTSIDLRKLNINWTVELTWQYENWYPIALDLDGDGLNLSAVDSSEIVARTASGGLSKMAWVGPTDAYLAVDRNGDGAINKLSEISFTQDKPGAKSDLEGLTTWDTNNDGLLDAKDTNFNKILLWQDVNQNGRSTKKELKTLTQAGIAAIDLKGVATGYTAKMGIESFVQHTMNFIRADGTKGDAFDVALARRILGSEGLYAGAYQAEWGKRDEDGILGVLKNDPKAEAKTARIKQKKQLLDKIGATYQEVKAKAQVDFSDHDKIDAKIAKRWEKLGQSERAAWLSGQTTGADNKIKLMTSERALQVTQATAQTATNDLVGAGVQQAKASVSGVTSGNATTSNAGVGAQTVTPSLTPAGLGLAMTASEPVGSPPASPASPVSTQAWWRDNTGSLGNSPSSLTGLLVAMEQTVTPATPATSIDPSVMQQQQLLRQSMAGFGGNSGGSSAAVWTRDIATATASLAASSGTNPSAKAASLGIAA